jgi:hypothetical protein
MTPMRRGDATDFDLMLDLDTELPGDAMTPSSRYDIWQAASLLIGLYGHEAPGYADGQRSEHFAAGDSGGTVVWDLIMREIDRLLDGAPALRYN